MAITIGTTGGDTARQPANRTDAAPKRPRNPVATPDAPREARRPRRAAPAAAAAAEGAAATTRRRVRPRRGTGAPAGAAAGAAAVTTRGRGAREIITRLGGDDAVRIVGESRGRAYGGPSPWRGTIREVEVIAPERIPSQGRLHSSGKGNAYGRWGALADDVLGRTPRDLNVRYNLGAAGGAGQLPDSFSPRRLAPGDRFLIGREGAPAPRSIGSLVERLRTRGLRAPLQIEYLDYPGRSAGAGSRAAYLGRFGAPVGVTDATRGAASLGDDALRGAGSAVDDAARGGARVASSLRGAGRLLGRAALPLAIGVSAFEAWSAWRDEGRFGPQTQQALARGVGGLAGGALGGALAGAALGSVVPGVGTVVGGIAGGIIGGIAGSELGGWIASEAGTIADAAGDAVDAVGDAAGDAVDAVGDAAGDAVDAVGDFVGGLFG